LNSSEHCRPQFAHPAEEVFAQILWILRHRMDLRAPHLPLEWDQQGNVVEAFAPDFYLPSQDLYIELTTLRPRLANYKNRRMRRMQ